jgi:hypothetical protein
MGDTKSFLALFLEAFSSFDEEPENQLFAAWVEGTREHTHSTSSKRLLFLLVGRSMDIAMVILLFF